MTRWIWQEAESISWIEFAEELNLESKVESKMHEIVFNFCGKVESVSCIFEITIDSYQITEYIWDT